MSVAWILVVGCTGPEGSTPKDPSPDDAHTGTPESTPPSPPAHSAAASGESAHTGGGPATRPPPLVEGQEYLLALDPSGTAWQLHPSLGDGTFDPPLLVADRAPDLWEAAVIADFDGDADLEFFASTPTGAGWLYDRASAADPFVGAAHDLGFVVRGTGDLNGDGHRDLFGTTAADAGASALGDGAGGFVVVADAFAWTLPGPLLHRLPATAVDFSFDGVPDLLTVEGDPFLAGGLSTLTLLIGAGDGTFGSPVVLGSAPTGATAAALGDLDGDLHWDLLGGLDDEPDAGGVWRAAGSRFGSFEAALPLVDALPGVEIAFGSGQGTGALAAHDFDHDGDDELVTSVYTAPGPADVEVAVWADALLGPAKTQVIRLPGGRPVLAVPAP